MLLLPRRLRLRPWGQHAAERQNIQTIHHRQIGCRLHEDVPVLPSHHRDESVEAQKLALEQPGISGAGL